MRLVRTDLCEAHRRRHERPDDRIRASGFATVFRASRVPARLKPQALLPLPMRTGRVRIEAPIAVPIAPRSLRMMTRILAPSCLVAMAASLAGNPADAQTRSARAALEVRVEVVQRCDIDATRRPVAGCEASVNDRLVERRDGPGRPLGMRESEEPQPAAGASRSAPAAPVRLRTITF